MKDENVYIRKDNGRYEPIGRVIDKDYLTDGIWYVRHRKRSFHATNMEYLTGVYRVAGATNVDFDVVAGVENIVDDIFESEEMSELRLKGFSIVDVIRLSVIKTINYSKKDDE